MLLGRHCGLKPPNRAVRRGGGLILSALTGTFSLPEDAAMGAVAGTISGKTSGSTLTLIDDAGGRVALSGVNILRGLVGLDYATATSHSFTVRETHPDAEPRETTLTLTVTEAGNNLDPEIAAMFANDEQGFVFDPALLTGDPSSSVAMLPDLSGNGNDLIAASAQPVRSASGGELMLMSAAGMDTADTVDLSGTSVVTIGLAIRKLFDTTSTVALELGPNSYTNPGVGIIAPNGNNAQNYSFWGYASSGGARTATTPAYPAGQHDILICEYDTTGAGNATEILPTINGAVPTGFVDAGSTIGAGNFAAAKLHLGHREGGAIPFTGWIGRCFAIDRALSPEEKAALSTWLGEYKVPSSAFGAFLGDSTFAYRAGPPVAYQTPGFVMPPQQYNCLAAAGHTIANQKAVWQGLGSGVKATFTFIVIQVGLNDTVSGDGSSAELKIAALQDLVDTVQADVSVPVYISQMVPERGNTLASVDYNRWRDINAAIAGQTVSPVDGRPISAITNVDGRITEHNTLLDDGDGYLVAAYDSGDGIHPNNLGRNINGWAILNKLRSDGFEPAPTSGATFDNASITWDDTSYTWDIAA